LNFFAEKHGKNQRDQHFSNISYFLEKESLVKRLVCTQDIVNAVIEHQNLANEERIKNKLEPTLFWIGIISEDDEPLQNSRIIKDITTFYNFGSNHKFELTSRQFSDKKEETIKSVSKCLTTERKGKDGKAGSNKSEKQVFCKNTQTELAGLKRKLEKIQTRCKKKKNTVS